MTSPTKINEIIDDHLKYRLNDNLYELDISELKGKINEFVRANIDALDYAIDGGGVMKELKTRLGLEDEA